MEYKVEKSQLTDNKFNDYQAQIAKNGDISWQRADGKGDTNVWYYSYSEKDGYAEDKSSAIGKAPQSETNPYINYSKGEGTSVVYEIETKDGDSNIWYWNSDRPEKDKTVKVAVTAKEETNPEVWGKYVGYTYQATPEQRDVYLYDQSDDSTTKIANDAKIDEYNPHIAGEYVIYEGKSGENWDIYRYDIAEKETIKIASTDQKETNAQLWSNGDVVYEYESGKDNKDIRYYDHLTGETTIIADSKYNEIKPDISGKYITYQAWDAEDKDYEIYRYDISEKTTERLTDNKFNDYDAQVSEAGYVAYEQDYSDGKNNEKRAYLYTDKNNLLGSSSDLPKGNEISMEPQIFGSQVTWSQWDGKDWEAWGAEISEEV